MNYILFCIFVIMDNKVESMIDVFILYLEYLNRWNKSHSIVSVLKTLKEDPSYFKENNLLNICRIEYEDTANMINEPIMSVDDFLSALLIKIRDEKINQIVS